eukprot:CAMPEP_0172497262 /NCGR_PEP_ID=MMETSP1066-20121228/97347_1 /TAXON_ID=671091 /ORGANISM="Coscinodiscus wailesii, Strain CCMP2513" /LENGTH=42 /DNA_ID= /DNA_START= /DNA_END= /DNA_ORIENTATION=
MMTIPVIRSPPILLPSEDDISAEDATDGGVNNEMLVGSHNCH